MNRSLKDLLFQYFRETEAQQGSFSFGPIEDSRADHVVTKHVEAEILGCCSKICGWNRQSCMFFPFLISLGKTPATPPSRGVTIFQGRVGHHFHPGDFLQGSTASLRCTWPLFLLKFGPFVTHKRPIFQQEKRPRTALCFNTFVKLKPSKPAL